MEWNRCHHTYQEGKNTLGNRLKRLGNLAFKKCQDMFNSLGVWAQICSIKYVEHAEQHFENGNVFSTSSHHNIISKPSEIIICFSKAILKQQKISDQEIWASFTKTSSRGLLTWKQLYCNPRNNTDSVPKSKHRQTWNTTWLFKSFRHMCLWIILTMPFPYCLK